MEQAITMASVLTAIILCLVGIIKIFFPKFKAAHPAGYKATFTGVSLALSVGACIIAQLFIVGHALNTTEFAVLLLSTLAGVCGLYSSYEGLGLKDLAKTLVGKIKVLASQAPESKFAKYVDKIGLDKALEIVNNKAAVKVEETNEAPAANVVENVETKAETPQQGV